MKPVFCVVNKIQACVNKKTLLKGNAGPGADIPVPSFLYVHRKSAYNEQCQWTCYLSYTKYVLRELRVDTYVVLLLLVIRAGLIEK